MFNKKDLEDKERILEENYARAMDQSAQQQQPLGMGMPRMSDRTADIMSKHMDTTEILNYFENLLRSKEYDEEKQRWVQSFLTVYDKDGNEVKIPTPLLMEEGTIRVVIGFLRQFQNPNTYLSELKEEEINNIMWDVSIKLFYLFRPLSKAGLQPHTLQMLWAMIEYPIFMSLKRAGRKITLDAISKNVSQQEIITSQPQQTKEQPAFKILGW